MLLRKLLIVEIALLFAQFWMGMTNNLFIVVPLNGPFNFLGYAGGLEVLAHVVDGSLILAIGMLIIWYNYKTQSKLTLKLSVLALVFTVSAIVSGTLFLEIFSFPKYYGVNDYFSMAMAMSFLAAFAVFFTEIYVIKNLKSLK